MEVTQKARVAAVVPAYNEAETLAEVLKVLQATPLIDEVLVVSDGSTDDTVEIARSQGVKAIHLRQNQGKGMAMAVGVAHTDARILTFVDGDILNLTTDQLDQLIEPVLSGSSDMNVGVRDRGPALNDFQRQHGPLLSGIRCLRREIFEAVPESHLEGFAVETGLNWACGELGMRITTTILHNLKHLVKEKKRGLVRGFRARMRMFAAVFGAYMVLRVQRPTLRRVLPHSQMVQPELEYINF
ncbi:MAG TPA: glycosyltransferase family 2 protein [Thermoanaerobaculia bacterium]|nr:glycosyltransferase family 2 protein [Thermoanaerobaculia bacterium]